MGQSINKNTDSKLFFVLPTSAAAAKRCCCSLDMWPQWQRCQSVQLTQTLFQKNIPDHSKQKTELSKLQSTDLNAIQNLISDCVSFSILLARTGVLRAHHSYLVPSSIVIPNVGWISAAFIKFSSVIASGNSSIESKKYRTLSEPTLYATQCLLRRF